MKEEATHCFTRAEQLEIAQPSPFPSPLESLPAVVTQIVLVTLFALRIKSILR